MERHEGPILSPDHAGDEVRVQVGEGGEGGGGGGFLLRRDGGTSETGCQRRSARPGCLLVARGGELLVTHLARSYSPLCRTSSSSLPPR